MKFCPKCKKNYGDEGMFCGECGVRLEALQEAVQDMAEESAPQQSAVAPQQEETEAQVNSNNAQAGNTATGAPNDSASKSTPKADFEAAVHTISQNPQVRKLEGTANAVYGHVMDLLKESRMGRGAYSMLTVGRIFVYNLLSMLIVYNIGSSLYDLSQIKGKTDGEIISAITSLPSLTPIFVLLIVNYAFATYLVLKRTRDMGMEDGVSKIVTGIFGAAAAYAVYTMKSSVDAIWNFLMGAVNGNFFSALDKSVTMLTTANDMFFAVKIMIVLDLVALVFAFFKGTPGNNHYGQKPTEL